MGRAALPWVDWRRLTAHGSLTHLKVGFTTHSVPLALRRLRRLYKGSIALVRRRLRRLRRQRSYLYGEEATAKELLWRLRRLDAQFGEVNATAGTTKGVLPWYLVSFMKHFTAAEGNTKDGERSLPPAWPSSPCHRLATVSNAPPCFVFSMHARCTLDGTMLFAGPTVRQYDSPTVRQSGSTAVRQYGSTRSKGSPNVCAGGRVRCKKDERSRRYMA